MSTTSSSNSSTSQGFSATCPSGKKVLGGGAYINNSPSHLGVALDGSAPLSGNNGWSASAHEVNSDATGWQVITYAICANVT